MSTRVLYDDQIFSTQHRGGVSRYFAELIRELQDPALGVVAETPFRHVVNEHLLDVDPTRWARPPGPLARGKLLLAWNQRLRKAYAGGLVHHTFYFERFLELPARARVCTVYDMVPELLPDQIPEAGRTLNAGKAAFVRACDAVLCISHTTRADLLAVYGELDKPVVVTPLGVAERFFGATAPAPGSRPYVLFVGERGGYKNAEVLLRAMVALPDLDLLCVGGQPFSADDLALLGRLGLSARTRHVVATDAELPGLYAGAHCLVFPSRYEGFGLPVVEAMAAGCPVLVADTPCLVEVGGEAVQRFPPDDDAALAALVSGLDREPWVQAGRVRAREFTWRRTAELTAELYRSLS